MSLKDYIIANIASAPAPLQWVYDPCRLAAELRNGQSTLTVGGKTYQVLAVRPHELLRFRRTYESLRAPGTPILVLSNGIPLVMADIVATCRAGKQGHVIDCSPKAILESPPPLGTGKQWHDLVNDLRDEFPPLLDTLVNLTTRQAGRLNPNTKSDALRLIIAANMQKHINTRILEKILRERLDCADLYALTLQWEQTTPDEAFRSLWRAFCEEQHAAPWTLFDHIEGSGKERSAWLIALESADAREQLRNYLWTTLILHHYQANVAALRPGVIGLQVEHLWTQRMALSPQDICAFLADLAKGHAKLFRTLTAEYERWLRANPAVQQQLLVALELTPDNPSLTRARQVIEQEDTFLTLFLAALRIIAKALCEDAVPVTAIGAGVWKQIQHYKRRARDNDRAAMNAFEAIYRIADRLYHLKEKDFLSKPQIGNIPDLWLKEIYPNYLAGLDLLTAKVKVANDTGQLVTAKALDTLRERCIHTLDAFNQEFCRLIQTHYLTW